MRHQVQIEAPGVVVVDDALSSQAVASLSSSIAATRLLGESQLVGGFGATRGFGVACHTDALDDAVAKAPFLRAFVDVAMNPRWRRLARPLDGVDRFLGLWVSEITALYLNVLVVPPGAAVERHVDATLGVVADDPRTIVPRAVVALYVDVPGDLSGGRLRLSRGDDEVAEIEPRPGRAVFFDGRLAHEVSATRASGPRVSCVAELYRLPRARQRALPRLRVQSNGFAEVLGRHQAQAAAHAKTDRGVRG